MKHKKKEIFTLQCEDNKTTKTLNLLKNNYKVTPSTEDKAYIQQPLVQSSNRQNINKFKNVNAQYHHHMQSGIELGPNSNNELLHMQFNEKILQLNQKKIHMQQKKQEQFDEQYSPQNGNMFLTLDEQEGNGKEKQMKTFSVAQQSQQKSVQQQTASQQEGNNEGQSQQHLEQMASQLQRSNAFKTSSNHEILQLLEYNKVKKLVNLDRHGHLQMNEIVNLAKSYILSDNGKSIQNQLKNKNNYILGKNIRNISYLARQRDTQSFKNIKSYSQIKN